MINLRKILVYFIGFFTLSFLNDSELCGQILLPHDNLTWGAIQVDLNLDSSYYQLNKILYEKIVTVEEHLGKEGTIKKDTINRYISEYDNTGKVVGKILEFKSGEIHRYTFEYQQGQLTKIQLYGEDDIIKNKWSISYCNNKINRIECDVSGEGGFELIIKYNKSGLLCRIDLMRSKKYLERRQYNYKKNIIEIKGENIERGMKYSYIYKQGLLNEYISYYISGSVNKKTYEYNEKGTLLAEFSYVLENDFWRFSGIKYVEFIDNSKLTHCFYGVHLYDVLEIYGERNLLYSRSEIKSNFYKNRTDFYSYVYSDNQ
jgi:hypothetical protein